MDFNDTPEEAAFREKARTWLDANAELKDPNESASGMLSERSDDATISAEMVASSLLSESMPLADSLGSLSSALASSQVRAFSRKAASSGVSLKSMKCLSCFGEQVGWVGPEGTLFLVLVDPVHELVLPGGCTAQRGFQELGSAVEEVAVILPRVSHTSVHLDHLHGDERERFAGLDA